MTHVAIVVGHHPDAKGAALTVGERQIAEYDFWLPFASALMRHLDWYDITSTVVRRPNPRPDAELMRRVNAYGARCAIELHFNGFSDPRARGSEMLHWHTSEQGRLLADLLQQYTVRTLRVHDRGLKAVRRGKGLAFLRGTRMPAVICEPAFGTNPGDAWRLLTRQTLLVEAYAAAIARYLSETSQPARKAA